MGLIRQFKNLFHFLIALIAQIYYNFPGRKLILIGVTGTDGKTTTSSLIYHLLIENNHQVGLISTVGAKINREDYSIGLHTTTPSPFLIQKLLRKMVLAKCRYGVIEVTSHAIDQNRIFGLDFEIGVLTNITHEHLDYHKTYQNYLLTKTRFLQICHQVVLNFDDDSFPLVDPLIVKEKITYGQKTGCDFQAKNINTYEDNQVFNINETAIFTNLLGNHNLYNLTATFACGSRLGLKTEEISSAIKSFLPVPGRMEIIVNKPFKVIIDFAHTPNAFKNILPAVKKNTQGKVIHVFGATGKRDRTKRPLMGEVSGNLADISIITSEDTYGENPDIIISEIVEGIKLTAKKLNDSYFIIPDRKKAISQALALASINDTVLLTGVGHQKTINVGKKEIPWNEKEVVLEMLKK